MKLCRTCHLCYEDEARACADASHAPLEMTRPGGRVIANRYRLEQLINDGHMGAVYYGSDLTTADPIALKLLRSEVTGTGANSYERFHREGVAVSLIKHPNVVSVRDHGRLEYGEAYLVLEFLEGPTLRTYIRESGPIPIATAVMIAWQVAQGLEAAHRMIVLHRDLKPENIMLTRDADNNLLVKVIDFGLAKIKPTIGDIDQGTLTPLGVFLGTAQYCAPELCRGLQLDSRSDIYSLGIIMYEMLAGKRPFLATTLAALCRQHVEETPPPILALRPDTPPELARLVTQALTKAPATRPQTAAEVAGRLRNVARSLRPEPFPTTHPIMESYVSAPHLPLSQTAFAGQRSNTLPDHLAEIITGPPRPVAPDLPQLKQRPRTLAQLTTQGRLQLALIIGLGGIIISAILILLLFFFY